MALRSASDPKKKGVQKISLVSVDEHGIFQEIDSELKHMEIRLADLDFCELDVQLNHESEKTRRKGGTSRWSMPHSEQYILASGSESLRQHINSLGDGWLNPKLYAGQFLVKRVTLFRVYRRMLQSKEANETCDDTYMRLKSFLDKTFKDTDIQLSELEKSGQITFDLLPYLFELQETITVRKHEKHETYGATLVNSFQRMEGGRGILELEYVRISYNGVRLQKYMEFAGIKGFAGARAIMSLIIQPLRCHPEEGKTQLTKTLTSQGQEFVRIAAAGRSSLFHDGPDFNSSMVPMHHHKGRVLLGYFPATHIPAPNVVEYSQVGELPEGDYIICNPVMEVYSAAYSMKVSVCVRHLSAIVWPKATILPGLEDKSQRLMETLIARKNELDKLQGPIVLIRGTDTDNPTTEDIIRKTKAHAYAEAVADEMKLPLIKFFGDTTRAGNFDFQSALQEVLEVARGGNAVVLLEEMNELLQAYPPRSITSLTLSRMFHLITCHQGLIFLSVDSSQKLDPRISKLVDHVLEFKKNEGQTTELIIAESSKLDPTTLPIFAQRVCSWLRFQGNGECPPEKVKAEVAARETSRKVGSDGADVYS